MLQVYNCLALLFSAKYLKKKPILRLTYKKECTPQVSTRKDINCIRLHSLDQPVLSKEVG